MAQKAEKISTLILEVDLCCCKCHRKIKKILCQLKDQENIKEINYDVNNNKVTISGPFDPHTLTRTLYCKACKIIKKISTPPPPPPPIIKPITKPDTKPTKPELPPGPACCAKPTYEWLYGVLKCASCGMVYTWTNQCPPPTDKKCMGTLSCGGGIKCSSSCCGSTTNYPCLPPPVDPCRPQCPPEPAVCCPRPSYVGMCGGTMCTSCGMKCPLTNQGPPTVTSSNQVCVPQSHHGYGRACGCGQLKPCDFIYEDDTPSCTIM
ncbi:Copper chaperone domain-containing protein [Dioscorea alata]|uniref:Copper chaperone domain-containing protein n=1 Tax=Dioscorea alata TaxID=55571 RepID=A0ACB7UJL7_DIOAL|nr:Copper chaperone domain-containing protein [Dioscorea alata]